MNEELFYVWKGKYVAWIICVFIFGAALVIASINLNHFDFRMDDNTASSIKDAMLTARVVSNNTYQPIYSIPSPSEVVTICKNKGFETGWVSQTCEEANMVQCLRKIQGLSDFQCVSVK